MTLSRAHPLIKTFIRLLTYKNVPQQPLQQLVRLLAVAVAAAPDNAHPLLFLLLWRQHDGEHLRKKKDAKKTKY